MIAAVGLVCGFGLAGCGGNETTTIVAPTPSGEFGGPEPTATLKSCDGADLTRCQSLHCGDVGRGGCCTVDGSCFDPQVQCSFPCTPPIPAGWIGSTQCGPAFPDNRSKACVLGTGPTPIPVTPTNTPTGPSASTPTHTPFGLPTTPTVTPTEGGPTATPTATGPQTSTPTATATSSGPANQHVLTIFSNCSQSISIGASPQVQSVSLNGTSLSILGGWKMAKGDTATVTVPLDWISGRFWARTGCSFDGSGTCSPSTSDCCDTGGCKVNGTDFGLNCSLSGADGATLAELTFKTGIQDNYDVSMVDGGNVSAEIAPDQADYDCSKDETCIFTGTLPNGQTNCTQDTDCWPLFGDGYKWKCDPNLKLCVNPFRCGSPGCQDSSGCAPVGIKSSLLPPCPWSAGSDLAISKDACPSDIQFNNDHNNGDTYVECIAPQKFCRIKCITNNDCPAPLTTSCGASGFCINAKNEVPGADCDTTAISCTKSEDCVAPGTCVANVCTGGTSTSKAQLWGCTGTNGNSCFTKDLTDPNCCGCPPWAPGFPGGPCKAGNNPEWQTVGEPVAATFNTACPTAYSFAYDDAIKLFSCLAKSGSTTNYKITFCPANTP